MGRYSKLPELPGFGHLAAEGRLPVARSRRVHAARRRLSTDTLAQLVADYEAGQPTTELMATYDLGKGTVLGLLRGVGIKLRAQARRTSISTRPYRASRTAGHWPK